MNFCLNFPLYLHPPNSWRWPFSSALLTGSPLMLPAIWTCFLYPSHNLGPWFHPGRSPSLPLRTVGPVFLPAWPKYCPCWDPATSLAVRDQQASLAYTHSPLPTSLPSILIFFCDVIVVASPASGAQALRRKKPGKEGTDGSLAGFVLTRKRRSHSPRSGVRQLQPTACFCKKSTRTQPHQPFTHCLWLCLCYSGRAEGSWRRLNSPESLKHLPSGPLQKKPPDLWPRWRPPRSTELNPCMGIFSPKPQGFWSCITSVSSSVKCGQWHILPHRVVEMTK